MAWSFGLRTVNHERSPQSERYDRGPLRIVTGMEAVPQNRQSAAAQEGLSLERLL
jgi:hypothetical protein